MKLHNCIICVKVLGQSRAGFLVVSSWSQVPSNHFLIGYKALYEMEPMPGALYWPKLLSGLHTFLLPFLIVFLYPIFPSPTLSVPLVPFCLLYFLPSIPLFLKSFPHSPLLVTSPLWLLQFQHTYANIKANIHMQYRAVSLSFCLWIISFWMIITVLYIYLETS